MTERLCAQTHTEIRVPVCTSPPGKPQELKPMDDTHVEVEIKPQLKLRGSVAKEEDPKPSH